MKVSKLLESSRRGELYHRFYPIFKPIDKYTAVFLYSLYAVFKYKSLVRTDRSALVFQYSYCEDGERK